jgi:hypothetical protein
MPQDNIGGAMSFGGASRLDRPSLTRLFFHRRASRRLDDHEH